MYYRSKTGWCTCIILCCVATRHVGILMLWLDEIVEIVRKNILKKNIIILKMKKNKRLNTVIDATEIN